MKLPVLLIVALTALLVTIPSQSQDSEESRKGAVSKEDLLESGSPTKPAEVSKTSEIRIVSYNIRWRSGKELEKLLKFFAEDPEIGDADVMGLQEVDRRKKRSGQTNTAKVIAERLGLHYAWAAPPAPKAKDEEETGVAILSRYPVSELTRLVLPHPGPNKRRRAALGASINVKGERWRVYSVHAETRISVSKKLEQMKAVLDDLAKYPSQTPAIVMGDFNTWEADADRKTEELFEKSGFKTPFGGEATFLRRVVFVPIELKLDWIWLRGLDATSFGIDRKITVSDHWPLWTRLKQK